MTKANLDRIKIGTSGFSYKDWLGNFYPQFCPQQDFLRFYATIFKTVEIDATFYRIPTAEMVKRWKKVTSDDFVFTAKFPRTVTHEGGIEERLSNMGAFIESMKHLEGKLGPLLLQFPYSFKPDEHEDIFLKLIEGLPDSGKFSVEVRNKKWLGDRFYGILKSKNVSLCLIDHPWMPRKTEFTGDFLYIRFLGDRKKIPNDFSYIRNEREDELDWWSRLIEEYSIDKGEVYAFFNNHYSGHSPSTARRLMEILGNK